MTTYRVNVHRDDRWWMLRLPDLDGVNGLGEAITQARRLADIDTEAIDYICTAADVAPSSVILDVHITVDDVNVTDEAAHLQQLRDQAASLEREVSESQARLARSLSDREVPVRDIGAALGVSYQRAHQLIA